ncbi:hypothetical protein GCM10027347_52770 [Larkinella harenae]
MEIKSHQQLTDVTRLSRNDVAPYYADLILFGSQKEVLRINGLILKKWQPSGLIYIKEKAWAIANTVGREAQETFSGKYTVELSPEKKKAVLERLSKMV